MVSFMITNNGSHPPDKWAEMTADTIVDTLLVDAHPNDASDAAIDARAAKRKLRVSLFEIFNSHHSSVQGHERGECAKCKKPQDAAARALAAIDVTPHMSIMNQVAAAFASTPFAGHFAKPKVLEVVQKIVGQHTANVMHIERRWHHDKMSKGA